jgi:Bacillus cereus group antimicrobial protein
MFKKLVVGALATGIMLSGGIGAVSASTEGVNNTKQGVAASGDYYNYEHGFYYNYFPAGNIYITYEIYSHNGIFANSFKSEGKTWHFKGVAHYNPDGSAYGHYEASK